MVWDLKLKARYKLNGGSGKMSPWIHLYDSYHTSIQKSCDVTVHLSNLSHTKQTIELDFQVNRISIGCHIHPFKLLISYAIKNGERLLRRGPHISNVILLELLI